ncbi:MAG TPA: signal peptidase I [Gemmatimonadaceae bacterium]|nr:signal peptidase I [Gemmatimonadaceae bacterium]
MAVAASKKRPSGGVKSRNVVAAARGKSARSSSKHSFTELLKGLLPAIAIFLFIRTFLIEAYRIPSGSMEPTLLVGDFLFVNKLAYGPHIPFTDYNLPGYATPRRGDVVIYESPSQANLPVEYQLADLTPTVVKRIVGLAGDTLYMRDGLLYVNGIAQRQGYGVGEKPEGWVDAPDPSFEWQKRVGLRRSRFGAAPAQPTHDNWGPFVVPADHFFSMGDNRYNSIDARYYGFVPRENIRGRPLFVYYSHDCAESGTVPLCFVTTVRWDRIGHRIR